MNPTHTPTPPSNTNTPWIHSENHPTDIIDEHGDFIGRCLRSEDAAFIVRTVNSHDIYRKALEKIANEDYRGNRSHSSETAFQAIAQAKVRP